MKLEQEHYSDGLIEDLKPLLALNWAHSGSHETDLELDPDFGRYEKMDRAGAVLCLTAREEGQLVGYVVFVISYSIHHRKVLAAYGDAMYVDPRYQGLGVTLLREAEQRLRARGVRRLGWYAPPGSDFLRFLEGSGYVPDEIVMEKVLCA